MTEFQMRLAKLTDELHSVVRKIGTIAADIESLSKSSEEVVQNVEEKNVDNFLLMREFDDLVMLPMKEWAEKSQKIGGVVDEASKLVVKLFDALREFLARAIVMKKVEDATELKKMLEPILMSLIAANEFKLKNKATPFDDHLEAIDAALAGVQWVTASTAPSAVVSDMLECSLFYMNRILKKYKKSDPIHAEWVGLWKITWDHMARYVKKSHTTGVAWNHHGSEKKVAQVLPAKMGAPPVPPPLDDKLFDSLDRLMKQQSLTGKSALFNEINQGESVTSRLKKVTADMQTHKNPQLRGKENIAPGNGKKEEEKNKSASVYRKNDKQWCVEHFVNDYAVDLEVLDKSNTVYIYKCKNSCIRIKGKLNAIIADNCTNTAIVFEDLVSQLEVINSRSMEIQTFGELPTVSIQKTDGCHVYLSKKSLNCKFVSSKSTEMNILAQLNENDNEFTEMAIPEQFVTEIVGKQLITVSSETV